MVFDDILTCAIKGFYFVHFHTTDSNGGDTYWEQRRREGLASKTRTRQGVRKYSRKHKKYADLLSSNGWCATRVTGFTEYCVALRSTA